MHFCSYGIWIYTMISLVLSDCPNGWSRYYDSCYKMSHDTETWIDAMNICKLHGGNLAEITSTRENNFVTSLIIAGKKSAWIGASDLGIDGEWTWVGSRDDLTFTAWAQGQPGSNAINENCLELGLHGLWNDQICHNVKPYVCERPTA